MAERSPAKMASSSKTFSTEQQASQNEPSVSKTGLPESVSARRATIMGLKRDFMSSSSSEASTQSSRKSSVVGFNPEGPQSRAVKPSASGTSRDSSSQSSARSSSSPQTSSVPLPTISSSSENVPVQSLAADLTESAPEEAPRREDPDTVEEGEVADEELAEDKGTCCNFMSKFCKCEKRTKLETLMIFCFFFGTFGSAGLIAINSMECYLRDTPLDVDYSSKFPPIESICNTLTCNETAYDMQIAIDPYIAPCKDFYRYSCGRWVGQKAFLASNRAHNRIEELVESVETRVARLLNASRHSQVEPHKHASYSLTSANRIYTKCANAGKMNSTLPLQNFARDLLGFSLPTLSKTFNNDSILDKNQLIKPGIMGRLLRAGFQPFMDISVKIDIKNTSKYSIVLDEMSFDHLALSPYKITKTLEVEFIGFYSHLLYKALDLLAEGATSDPEARFVDVMNLVEFELTLSKEQRIRSEPRKFENLYKSLTVKDLEWTLGLPRTYLVEILRMVLPARIPVTETTSIYCLNLGYFQALFNLLKTYDARVLAIYLSWSVIREYGQETTPDFQRLMNIYYETFHIPHNIREKRCLLTVMEMYKYAIVGPYAQEFFPNEDKVEVEEMLNNVVSALIVDLKDEEKTTWLNENERQSAVNKLENMVHFVAYPDWVLSTSTVDKFYRELNAIFEDDSRPFFMDKHKYSQYMARKEFSKLSDKPKRSKWLNLQRETDEVDRAQAMNRMKNFFRAMIGTDVSYADMVQQTWNSINTDSPLDSHVHYNVRQNTIRVMVGLLDGAVYNKNRPMALNYGALGFMLAHQVFHAVDEKGSNFDKFGNLKSWWLKESQRKFYRISHCLETVFNKTSDPYTNLFLRGDVANSENVADNAAIRIAFQAYEIWKQKNQDQRLGNLDYFDSDHLFFLGFSQSWCDSKTIPMLEKEIATGQVIPPRYKVNIALDSFSKFTDLYSCTKKNKAKKCDARVFKY